MDTKIGFKITDTADYIQGNSSIKNKHNDRISTSQTMKSKNSNPSTTKSKSKGFLANRFLDYNNYASTLDSICTINNLNKPRAAEVSPNNRYKEYNKDRSVVNTNPSELNIDEKSKTDIIPSEKNIVNLAKVQPKPTLMSNSNKEDRYNFTIETNPNKDNRVYKEEEENLNTKLTKPYSNLLKQSKDHLTTTQSINYKNPYSVRSTNSLNSPISQRSSSVLASIYSTNKFSEQKRANELINSMKKSGSLFMDINKEEFFSDSTSSQFKNTINDLALNGKDKLNYETQMKKNELENLTKNIEALEEKLNSTKEELSIREKNTKIVNLDVQKLNAIDDNSKRKSNFNSKEANELNDQIKKMEEDYNFIIQENTVYEEEVKKDTNYISYIKSEAKNLEKIIIDKKSEIKIIQRAIIIKCKEINKHKINLKTNEMRMKGIVSSLVKAHTTIVGEEDK